MTEVFIYCDDAAHRQRMKVIKFYRFRQSWSEHPEVLLLTCGVQLVGDDLPTADNPLMAGLEAGNVRWRAQLGCRRCRVPLVARDTTLFAALDDLAAAGVSEISLSTLRASVNRIST